MNNDYLQQWAAMNKHFMDSMKQLSEISNGMMGKLTEQQMAMVSAYMDGLSKQLEAMSEAKGIQEMAAAQAKIAKEFNDKLLENTQRNMAALTEARAEMTAWLEKGMDAAAHAASSVAKGK